MKPAKIRKMHRAIVKDKARKYSDAPRITAMQGDVMDKHRCFYLGSNIRLFK